MKNIKEFIKESLVTEAITVDRIKNFSKITKEDIIKVSKKVNLHTILTLENKEDDHEED